MTPPRSCFLDGMDPMTSNNLQARHSYRPSEIRLNERFAAIELQANRRGQVGLNFTQFDQTAAAGPSGRAAAGEDGVRPNSSMPDFEVIEAVGTSEVNITSLRSRTFRTISHVEEDGEEEDDADQARSSSSAGAKPKRRGQAAQPRAQSVGSHAAVFSGGDNGMGPLGSSSPPQALGPSMLALIDAVLADSSSSTALRRQAALAKAEALGSSLLMSGGQAGSNDHPSLPVSVMPSSGHSRGGDLMNPFVLTE